MFAGVLAFYLNETNHRTAPPPGQTLQELSSWKYDKWKRAKEQAQHTEEVDPESMNWQAEAIAAVTKEEKQ